MEQPMAKKAETYLVQVYKPASDADNFTLMRAEVFHHTKGSSHQTLPPTSEGLLPHIKRGYFCAYNIVHALDTYLDPENTVSLKPKDFGYTFNKESLFEPETAWKILEPTMTVVCHCKTCSRVSCPCRAS